MKLKKVGRNREWLANASPQMKESFEDVVLRIGDDVLTRQDAAEAGFISLPALRNLGTVLARILPRFSPRPNGVVELYQRMGLEYLMSDPGVGEATVGAWLDLLVAFGCDPMQDFPLQLKLPTLCRKKKKRRRRQDAI